jgi:hypothetical protein
MARFDQVITDKCHPEEARIRIIAATKKYGTDVKEFESAKALQEHIKRRLSEGTQPLDCTPLLTDGGVRRISCGT